MSQLPITVTFVKKDGELISSGGKLDKIKSDIFLQNMREGQLVSVTYEVNGELGTYAQLAKLHACIRELAKDTGTTFEDMKSEIKRRSGLVNADKTLKSFADCSIDDLSGAIVTCMDIGEMLGINLR